METFTMTESSISNLSKEIVKENIHISTGVDLVIWGLQANSVLFYKVKKQHFDFRTINIHFGTIKIVFWNRW